MSPLVTAEHRDRVVGYLDVATAQGATLVVDGRQRPVAGEGLFLAPSLVDTGARVYQEETFGPSASVIGLGSRLNRPHR